MGPQKELDFDLKNLQGSGRIGRGLCILPQRGLHVPAPAALDHRGQEMEAAQMSINRFVDNKSRCTQTKEDYSVIKKELRFDTCSTVSKCQNSYGVKPQN